MKLSVVIVNYNVEYFLEQCLLSVRKAMKDIEGEVFVVDNNSVDNSVAMVREKFPEVNVIANKENTGFSKANNQAINISSGEYVLLLNPDTVVQEDTFTSVIDFMDAHPDAGGLGVKMLDGKGKFLPESKRGLPTPTVAFYKIFGLSKLFPKSKRFGQYHLGYLDDDEIHEIDVLSGAFMLMRKEALDKVGLLDETFFMYGEDIDLSYRIQQGGYKNYYFPKTQIIHYKGESTKKSSINYVFVFYRAMVIFAEKHFSQQNAKTFSFLINLAIYFRAGIAILNRFIKRAALPVLDMALSILGFWGIKEIYQQVKGIDYDYKLVFASAAAAAVIWFLSVLINGGYDKPVKLKKIGRGIFIGGVVILILYSLLPESYRFSRAIVLLATGWSFIHYFLVRYLLHLLNREGYSLQETAVKKVAIVGKEEDCRRIHDLLEQTNSKPDKVYFVHSEEGKNDFFNARIHQLKDLIEIYKINEVIFSAKDLSSQRIIELMSILPAKHTDFKIAPPESLYIIGSNSIDTSGDMYVLEVNSINKTENLRRKRILDFFLSLFLIITFPLTIFFVKNKANYLPNLFRIFMGRYTFVGYAQRKNQKEYKLPKIKPGILSPLDNSSLKNEETIIKLNAVYAKNYKLRFDIKIILKAFGELGRA